MRSVSSPSPVSTVSGDRFSQTRTQSFPPAVETVSGAHPRHASTCSVPGPPATTSLPSPTSVDRYASRGRVLESTTSSPVPGKTAQRPETSSGCAVVTQMVSFPAPVITRLAPFVTTTSSPDVPRSGESKSSVALVPAIVAFSPRQLGAASSAGALASAAAGTVNAPIIKPTTAMRGARLQPALLSGPRDVFLTLMADVLPDGRYAWRWCDDQSCVS